MKRNLKITIAVMTAACVLSGCATSTPALHGKLDPTLGSAVKANIAKHAVAPTAAQKANTFIPADSTRTRQARQNYRDNKIPDPVRELSSKSGSGK